MEQEIIKQKKAYSKGGQGRPPKLRPGRGFKIPGTKTRYWMDNAQMMELFSLLELEDYDAVREYMQDIKTMQKIPFRKKEAEEQGLLVGGTQ